MNKLYILISVFLLTYTSLHSQNLDSLYNKFLEIKTGQKLITGIEKPDEENFEKCGTSIINKVKLNLSAFSKERQSIITTFLGRPSAVNSIVTNLGKFRIHYDTEGENKLSFDINTVCAIFDSVYLFEVEKLGYPAPPADFGGGGDDLYDIYIINQPGGIYGYTETETYLSANTYTTFMVVDNDFAGYYSQGLNGLRVTAAHEFHHAIQMGNYILRDQDTFYYEITSTAMEEFVFDYVNDYFYYVRSLMLNPSKNFKSYNYNYALWNIYLKEKFGYGIIKRTWELMKNQTAMDAISNAIIEYGSTFKAELNTFATWLYFTGYRHKQGKYFPDAKYFPELKISMSYAFNPPLQMIGINSYPSSNNFVRFGNGADTLVTIITNGNINTTSMTWIDLSLRNTFNEGFIGVGNDYFYKYQVPDDVKNLFCSSAILNDSSSFNNGNLNITYVYPQPFIYSKEIDYGINFPVKDKTNLEVNLYIYDINMKLIYSGKHGFIPGVNPYINWNGITENGKLNSGIYLYVTESDGKILKGKFAVIND